MGVGRGPGAATPDDRAEAAFATAQALLEQAALLVAEARRVLEAAGGPVPSPAATIDLRDHAPEGEPEIGRVIAPGATRLTRGAHPSRLDTLLASAIESAVDDTFAGRASA